MFKRLLFTACILAGNAVNAELAAQQGTCSVYRITTVNGHMVENTLVQRKFYDSTGLLARQQDYNEGALTYTTDYRYNESRIAAVTVSKDRKELERTVYTYRKCGTPASRTFYLNGKAETLQTFEFGAGCLVTGMNEQVQETNKWKDTRRELRTYDSNDSLLRQLMIRGKNDTVLNVSFIRTADSVSRITLGTDRELVEEERTAFAGGLPSVKQFFENGKLVSEEHFVYKNGKMAERIRSSPEGLIESETFTYDDRGRLLQRRLYDAGIREVIYEYRYE